MGKVHAEIDDKLREFIAAQRLFFVATAPSGSGGHVNLSPKGGDSKKKGPEGSKPIARRNNARSIDGLDGLPSVQVSGDATESK